MTDWKPFIFLFLFLTFSTMTMGGKTWTSSDLAIRSHYHQPTRYPPPIYYNKNNLIRQMTQIKECDGEENFKSDIGIVSFKLSVISSTAGLFSLAGFSFPSNNISIISTIISLVLWVPSAILTFFAWSDPFSWANGNIVNLGSLLITLYGGFGIVTGTADLIVSTIDEVLGIIAILLGALTTFPDVYDEIKMLVEEWLGKVVVDQFLKGYGCGQNDYDFIRELIVGI